MGYWIKLYTDILDDYKYKRLPTESQVLMYELFLLAGKLDNEGRLPDSIDELSFLLRRDSQWMETNIKPLVDAKIITNHDGYTVTKFAERQSPLTDAERMKKLRERRNNTKRYEHVTEPLLDCYEGVTKSNVDTDIDTDTESDTEKIQRESEREIQNVTLTRTPTPAIIKDLMTITGYSPKKETWDYLIQKIGDGWDPALFKQVASGWISEGYSPRNANGMIDWYLKGATSSVEARA